MKLLDVMFPRELLIHPEKSVVYFTMTKKQPGIKIKYALSH